MAASARTSQQGIQYSRQHRMWVFGKQGALISARAMLWDCLGALTAFQGVPMCGRPLYSHLSMCLRRYEISSTFFFHDITERGLVCTTGELCLHCIADVAVCRCRLSRLRFCCAANYTLNENAVITVDNSGCAVRSLFAFDWSSTVFLKINVDTCFCLDTVEAPEMA